MKRKVQRNTRIPDDVLFNVLELLPAKSLMRFKCVCKAWHGLICNPSFAESHHASSRSRQNASYIIFYMGVSTFQIQALVPTNLEAVFSSEIHLNTFHRCVPCTSVVHGLICLLDSQNHELEMLNITTGEKIPLPLPWNTRHGDYYSTSFTMGFDPVTKKYKLLFFRKSFGPNAQIIIEGCEIFTLGTSSKSWRYVNCPSYGYTSKAICVNGVTYWLDGMIVRYFDVKAETFGFLSLPEGAKEYVQLTQVGGTLALVCKRYISIATFDLWKLINSTNKKAFGDKDEIFLPGYNAYSFQVIGSTQRGEILIIKDQYSKDILEVTFYNVESASFRIAKLTWPHCQPASIGSLLSLVSGIVVADHVENIVPLRAVMGENDDNIKNNMPLRAFARQKVVKRQKGKQ